MAVKAWKKAVQELGKPLPKQLNRIMYLVDSRTVLCWIQNDKHRKQYVKHRVDEMRQLTAKKDWRFCPGMQNPADLPSRGLTGNEMVDNSTWWCGPQFLQLPEEECPQEEATVDTNEAALSEVVRNLPKVIHVLASSEEIPTDVNLAEIINCQQLSSLDRLLRVTAYVPGLVAFVKERFHNAVEIDILGIFEGYSSLQIWPPKKLFRGEIIQGE